MRRGGRNSIGRALLCQRGFLGIHIERCPQRLHNLYYQEIMAMRCPYLEQILKKRQAFLKVFQADCHVDRKVHRFWGVFTWPTPPCLGKPATCELYHDARASEDLRLRRFID